MYRSALRGAETQHERSPGIFSMAGNNLILSASVEILFAWLRRVFVPECLMAGGRRASRAAAETRSITLEHFIENQLKRDMFTFFHRCGGFFWITHTHKGCACVFWDFMFCILQIHNCSFFCLFSVGLQSRAHLGAATAPVDIVRLHWSSSEHRCLVDGGEDVFSDSPDQTDLQLYRQRLILSPSFQDGLVLELKLEQQFALCRS